MESDVKATVEDLETIFGFQRKDTSAEALIIQKYKIVPKGAVKTEEGTAQIMLSVDEAAKLLTVREATDLKAAGWFEKDDCLCKYL